MKNEGTCRRCSVIRVNVLCDLYDEAFQDHNDRAKKQLQTLIKTAQERGYPDGIKILLPSLAPEYVRKLCWNISSVLNDQDFLKQGINIDGRKRSSY